MGFADNFPAISSSIIGTFGEAVTYTGSDGIPHSITAVITYGDDLESAQWNTALQATAQAMVLKTDVAEWSEGDTITIGSLTWTVLKAIDQTPGDWTLEIRRDLRPVFRK